MAPSTQVVTTTATATKQNESDWSLGWRFESVRTANGREDLVRIPLTPEEALHPEEGYVIPVSTAHTDTTIDIRNMLRARYTSQPTMAVFHDLVFEWDHPEIGNYAPDIAVVPHVREREADRGTFNVAQEGTRPLLIIEVVSPRTRKDDRVTKVKDYARLGVQEYVYIDKRTQKGETLWEVAGFRLDEGFYLPIVPDEDGAIYCETLNIRIGLEQGQIWIEDANTGKDLLTNLQAQQALLAAEEQTKIEAEARRAAEEQVKIEADARQAAEARVAELEAQMRAWQQAANQATENP